VCDLDSAAFTPPDGIDTYVSQGIFFDLFWWNYFGPEYSAWTTVNGPIASLVAGTRGHPDGAAVVETRQAPTSLIDTKVITEAVAQWPVFLRWNPRAARVADIDYWEVRRLAAAPPPVDRKVADFVGPADAFIASVSENAKRFMEWAVANGAEPKTEEEFRQLFREKYAVILDQYLVAAIAAYGEVVRRKTGGEWAKAWLFGRGEPVVGRRGRPWSRRRVIFEALEALQEPSVNSR
jgi:hypothetical protein